MKILVGKLKPSINEYYVKKQYFTETDFISGIVEIIDNHTYWNRLHY
ncbi:MAG: hypothetical protein Satyrvirus2_46 [Satyrvirus sp.]|uniref:Uncharacterized protein n=1 Tax=Satyrvirus sp. TaxID=2487771 RepID=A0A3G5ACT4_9VIRU|nr:MAG: hypothetical protein Satyrvirus2_46 [Satyrvirus sp.]